ncbi:reverse transcriptase domain-containing protein, partial [Klebsiella pneumoniae]|uniref:reverse transcriptase domain-containing protein n=1 Tax=Klebsiella pneumoniae TaxID=573 RepID=UPI0034D972A8
MVVYVDGMLVKCLEESQHIFYLKIYFNLLRYYNMQLNLTKCAFEVTSRKFLGFMVTH